jgi:hypothetical protein
MAAKDAGRYEQTSSVASADTPSATPDPPSWFRRVSFWRAVTGMALALALACAIVASEFSTELLQRTRHFHHRIGQLSSNLATMRGKIATDDREIADMRNAVEIDDNLRRILAAPDARLIRLTPPARASQAAGVIAFSTTLRSAAIELAGLPAPAPDVALNLWWTGEKRAPLLAVRLHPTKAGKVALMLELPAADQLIHGAMITADSGAAPPQLNGMIVLKGAVAAVPAPTTKARHLEARHG